MWLLGYCHWWLEDRLVCLDGDKIAVGMLMEIELPEGKSWPDSYDTDYSINLLLWPNNPGDDEIVEESKPYGYLIKEHRSTHEVHLAWTGVHVALKNDKGVDVNPPPTALHAEFEGRGIKDLLLGTQIALFLAVAALIFCLALPPPYGAIIAVFLAILAFLAGLIGSAVGLGDKGSPTDVNPDLVSLHTAEDPLGADILAVMGRWVYDTTHNRETPKRGWNEIHPIKLCVRLPVF